MCLRISIQKFCVLTYLSSQSAKQVLVSVADSEIAAAAIVTMTPVKMAINHLLVSELRGVIRMLSWKRNLMILFLFSIQQWFTSLRRLWLVRINGLVQRKPGENSSPFIDLTLFIVEDTLGNTILDAGHLSSSFVFITRYYLCYICLFFFSGLWINLYFYNVWHLIVLTIDNL